MRQAMAGLLNQVLDTDRVIEQASSFTGQFDLAPVPVEKPHAQFRFELLDGDRQRGLRHVQRLRGAREAAEARDREAVAQCTDVHTESLFGG